MHRSDWFRANMGVPESAAAMKTTLGLVSGSTFTQTYSTASTTVAAMTAPTAGNGSGADATTFSGAECDALTADVLGNKKNITAIIDALQAAGIVV
jgi:hypothetical protein